MLVPRPAFYWIDFLASITCFYAGFAATAVLPLNNPFKFLGAVVAVLSMYRAVVFIHELAHLSPGRVRGFRLAWNLLCGIPLLVPSFLYGSHRDHHARRAYGTTKDGEYRPWGCPGNRIGIVMFASSSFLGLPAGVLRFGILGPLSWFNPRIWEWVAVNASSLVVDPRYRRDPPSQQEARGWRVQEACVFVYLLAIAAALVTGLINAELLVQLYLITAAGPAPEQLAHLGGAPLSLGGWSTDGDPAIAQFVELSAALLADPAVGAGRAAVSRHASSVPQHSVS